MATTKDRAAGGAGQVLLTLASAQSVMTLDSAVMNVSIATVAKDVGTMVTGIQTAITSYPLVMASSMITGGKLGQIWGHRRAFNRRWVATEPRRPDWHGEIQPRMVAIAASAEIRQVHG